MDALPRTELVLLVPLSRITSKDGSLGLMLATLKWSMAVGLHALQPAKRLRLLQDDTLLGAPETT